MIQAKKEIKTKFLILVVLLKRQITMLKSLKQRVKYKVLVAALLTVENKIPNINS